MPTKVPTIEPTFDPTTESEFSWAPTNEPTSEPSVRNKSLVLLSSPFFFDSVFFVKELVENSLKETLEM